jgi:hypothetical protein
VHPKHVAVLVIKGWKTKRCVELVGTDWKWLIHIHNGMGNPKVCRFFKEEWLVYLPPAVTLKRPALYPHHVLFICVSTILTINVPVISIKTLLKVWF